MGFCTYIPPNNSAFLAHKVLIVSYFDWPLSVILGCPSCIISQSSVNDFTETTTSWKRFLDFDQTNTGMILGWSPTKVVPVGCIIGNKVRK